MTLMWGQTASKAAELPASPPEVVEMVAKTGILSADQIEKVDDRYVGELFVGGATQLKGEGAVGSGISVVVYPGADGGTEQVQFILLPPWGNLRPRVEAMAEVLVDLAGPTPQGPQFSDEEDPARAEMTPSAQWLYGIMLESWLGWPGSPQRVVRVIDGVAVIVEGVPPDIWGVTITPDAGYADWTWPGISPETDSAEVTEARLAIRQGDYDTAMALLEVAGRRDEAAAGALLGDMYKLGRLGPANQDTASDWYLVAGRHRYGPGIYSLAMMSQDGWGIMFMNNLRLPLVEEAAEAHMADAVYILSSQENGVFYMRPEDVTVFDQVHQAATWGLLAAQLDLAERFVAGDGVDRDPVLAYAWALVALDNTDPGLDYIRSHQLAADLSHELNDAEIAEAQRLAANLVTGSSDVLLNP